MCELVDPLPVMRKWLPKIFIMHGKCATVKWDIIRTYGINGPQRWAFHRFPGMGDLHWTDVISELRWGGFRGCIDVEGWHDPVYRGDLEMTGQVYALNYLKRCEAAEKNDLRSFLPAAMVDRPGTCFRMILLCASASLR